MQRSYQPVGNGLRTDHPVPDVPFVDDAHIPVDDPAGIEAVGRGRDKGMWGREDRCPEGGWVAFTTDPVRTDLAWCVRWHPDYGRSVILMRDEDAASMHMTWWGPPLLFRAGGYWWDGTAWYRPMQVWDRATETYVRRRVPAATTITVADLLAGRAGPGNGRILPVVDVNIDAGPVTQWLDELAVWAEHRGDLESLTACVVKVTAPELSADQMVGLAQVAEIGGVAASTLRAYVSRGEADVPAPQATVGGRSLWARPVAEEWAEQRRRSAAGTKEAVSTERRGASLPVGIADLWQRFTQMFYIDMWERPDFRKRWALRWRNEAAVQDAAELLGRSAAASLDRIVPVYDLAVTLRYALLGSIAESQRDYGIGTAGGSQFFGLAPQLTRMLDWLIRHEPDAAAAAIGETVGDAERMLAIHRAAVLNSLQTALSLDGRLDDAMYTEFFERFFPPEPSS